MIARIRCALKGKKLVGFKTIPATKEGEQDAENGPRVARSKTGSVKQGVTKTGGVKVGFTKLGLSKL